MEEEGQENRVNLSTGALELAASGKRREYRVVFVRAGRLRRQGGGLANIEVPAEPLKTAAEAGKFEARASFIDHADWFQYPSLRNLVGVTVGAAWNEESQAVEGVIRLYDGPAGEILAPMLDGMLEDQARGEPAPDIGLSMVFWPKWAPRDNEEDPLRLAEIRHVESVDFVFEPATDSRVKGALAALAALGEGQSGFGQRENGGLEMSSEDVEVEREERAPGAQAAEVPAGGQGGGSAAQVEAGTPPAGQAQRVQAGGASPENRSRREAEGAIEAAEAAAGAAQANAWARALAQTAAETMIAGSGLPAASRSRLGAQRFRSPEAVQAAIEAERAYLAALQADQVVELGGRAPRGGDIQAGRSGLERLELALQALIEGRRPPDGIHPLSGVRELYNLLSGDYEMHGVFQPERVQFANVNSSTMAGLVANALNKSIINEFQEYPRWWESIVRVEDFNNLQQVKWITLGGVSELPTVPEGAAYTELLWDDQTETADFVKKGGYLGLTIEAIDKDDTNRLRTAPRALAQAAWLSLSKAISGIFTSNPTMSDGVALFHADHSNLGSTALSYDAWDATRKAMRKQTDLGSSERLGALTAPKFLLVPPDLEGTALQTLATEQVPAQANYRENVYAEGDAHDARLSAARRRVIVIDLWTDTTDWAAVADPRLYPSIGLGFRYGRTPEVFSIASPTAGLMFTNDTLPVKVRFFFATGPTDWRGLYKHVVA